jgi:hypothetical protein
MDQVKLALPVVLILGGLLILQSDASGRTRPTVEQGSHFLVTRSVRHFAEDHQDHSPTNWAQIESYTDFNVANVPLAEQGLPLIQETYVFVPFALSMQGLERGRVVVARVAPLTETDEIPRTGRYVVYQDSGGGIRGTWVEEAVFQHMLAKVGLPLPAPDPEAESKAKEAIRAALAAKKVTEQAITNVAIGAWIQYHGRWILGGALVLLLLFGGWWFWSGPKESNRRGGGDPGVH